VIGTDAVIGESLEHVSDPSLKPGRLGERLAAAIDADLPDSLNDAALYAHPLAVWIELEIGLEEGQRLERRKAITIEEATKRLAELGTQPGDERHRAGVAWTNNFTLNEFNFGQGPKYAIMHLERN
jgi:hypothetical protein